MSFLSPITTLFLLFTLSSVSILQGQDRDQTDATPPNRQSKTSEKPMIKFVAGEQVANSISVSDGDGKTREIGFWVYTPADYAEKDSHPWMMFLHGMGERGDDLDLVKVWGPPKRVTDKEDFPFVLISPQCPGDIVWNTEHLTQLLDLVESQMKVNKKRLYMTGLSMGGYGTWAMAAAVPDRIAAAIPICGGGRPETASKMIDVPIWAFHGDQDRAVSIKRSQQMVEAVKEAGGNAKLTTYEGVNHNSWSQTYANEEIYQWLLKHTTDR